MAISARKQMAEDFRNWDDSYRPGGRAAKAQRARRRAVTKLIWVALALVALFGWVVVYANVNAIGNQRSSLLQEYKRELRKNERLKAQWQGLISPDRVARYGPGTGMVYPVQCDEVRSEAMAKAENTD